jgi:GTP-binding protein
MWEELPPMLTSSSEKGSGREEILAFIEECLSVTE